MPDEATFYEVVAFVNPYHPYTSQPFMTMYADTKELRDQLVERFERDSLIVKVNIKRFYRQGDLR